MERIRKWLIAGLLFSLGLFLQQNFSWLQGLYGSGLQKGLQQLNISPFFTKKIYNENIYLVKLQKDNSFIYGLLSYKTHFKGQLWLFYKAIISNQLTKNIILINNLSSCGLNEVNILKASKVEFLINILIVTSMLFIVSIYLLSQKKNNFSNNKLDKKSYMNDTYCKPAAKLVFK